MKVKPKPAQVVKSQPLRVQVESKPEPKNETQIVAEQVEALAKENASDNGAYQTDEIRSNKGSRKE